MGRAHTQRFIRLRQISKINCFGKGEKLNATPYGKECAKREHNISTQP